MLALGSRLGPFGTLPQYGFDYWPANAKLIQIDADPRVLGLVKKTSVTRITSYNVCYTKLLRGMTELRTWTDDIFAKYFLNLPGVASVEVGGGLVREVHVLPDHVITSYSIHYTKLYELPPMSPGSARSLVVHRFGRAGARPKAYLQAAIHANELPGAMALHHLLPMLVDAERRGRLRGEIVVVPVVNPIGLSQLVSNNHLGRYDFVGRENFV